MKLLASFCVLLLYCSTLSAQNPRGVLCQLLVGNLTEQSSSDLGNPQLRTIIVVDGTYEMPPSLATPAQIQRFREIRNDDLPTVLDFEYGLSIVGMKSIRDIQWRLRDQEKNGLPAGGELLESSGENKTHGALGPISSHYYLKMIPHLHSAVSAAEFSAVLGFDNLASLKGAISEIEKEVQIRRSSFHIEKQGMNLYVSNIDMSLEAGRVFADFLIKYFSQN